MRSRPCGAGCKKGALPGLPEETHLFTMEPAIVLTFATIHISRYHRDHALSHAPSKFAPATTASCLELARSGMVLLRIAGTALSYRTTTQGEALWGTGIWWPSMQSTMSLRSPQVTFSPALVPCTVNFQLFLVREGGGGIWGCCL